MNLSEKLRKAITPDDVKMKLALEMDKSYNTLQRYIQTNSVKLLRDFNKAALTKITGIPESELFEFELQIHFMNKEEKDHETIIVLAGSIQEAVNKGCAVFDTRSTISKYAMYNNEKYNKR